MGAHQGVANLERRGRSLLPYGLNSCSFGSADSSALRLAGESSGWLGDE
jgi:hypothetical protein